jgi:hypothetical protein
LTQHQGLPVAGYTGQSDENVDLVNELKHAEERYLRLLDKIVGIRRPGDAAKPEADRRSQFDGRFVALAKTHMQTANMFAVRAIFQPTRIKLPEDA